MFIGLVRSIETIEPVQQNQRPGFIFVDPMPRIRVRMVVVEVLRGSLPSEIDIDPGSGAIGCGYSFQPNETYLVYASRTGDGVLIAGACSGTQPIADATADLEYLRSLRLVRPALGTIFGTARVMTAQGLEAYPPLPGVRVVAASGTAQSDVLTGPDGAYELHVPPGEYTVSLDLPDGFYVPAHRAEIVDGRGCAQVDIVARSDGRIVGRLLTAQGDPVPRQRVGLYQRRAVPRPSPGQLSADRLFNVEGATTDMAGRFAFSALEVGTYFIGVETGEADAPGGSRPLLFPGSLDPEAATAITVAPGERTIVGDYLLPDSIVLLQAVLRAPDGRPRPDVSLQVETLDPQGQWSRVALLLLLRSDAEGRVYLPVQAGGFYRLAVGQVESPGGALSADRPRPRRVESPGFVAVPGLPLIELVLPD